MPEVVKKQEMGPGGYLAMVLTIYSEEKASLTTPATGAEPEQRVAGTAAKEASPACVIAQGDVVFVSF